MTSKRDSDTLTRVSAGTPMGELMRQYWLPALKSDELVADGDPVRFRLLGENLIAFRDTKGRVGVMDHRCPHRCASLFFGRNEEGGIRCVYHGWKFDVEGNCLEMANVPPHQDFRQKVHAKAYKAAERNGLVWVYMGAAEEAPDMPDIFATLIPETENRIYMVMRECNWLQGLEGDIDTSHLNFLHLGSMNSSDFDAEDPNKFGVIHRDPEYKAADTDVGTFYGAYRPADPGSTYWRFAHFMFPCWTLAPFKPFETYNIARAWVPLDDTHLMFIMIGPEDNDVNGDARESVIPNTTDWLGRYRAHLTMENDYKIDREAQRTSSFSGIEGIHMQDQAITESMGMGGITDHTWEHLVSSDEMISVTRRRLLRAANALAKDGTRPPGADTPALYGEMRGGFFVAPEDRKFPDVYHNQLAAIADVKATVAAE